jgi:hypothetical protein
MAGTTGDTRTELEQQRLDAMKELYVTGHRFSEMVNPLKAAGLIGCQNCDDPKRQRRNINGEIICRTCANTIAVFWERNEHELKVTEKDLERVKWEWSGVQRFVMRACHRHYLREIVTSTTKTEIVRVENPKDGEPIERPVVTTTERREWRIDRGLLQLMSTVADKIAKVNGMDLDEPEGDGIPPGGKVTFETPEGDDVVM